MKFVVKTDVGIRRTVNEDRVDVLEHKDSIILSVIADGMGGHNAGDVASEIAVSEFHKYFSTIDENTISTTDEAKEWLNYVFQSINQSVIRHSTENAGCEGMGTTLIAGLFYGKTGVIAHVGDSRVYRFTDQKVEQITRDHSYVNALLDSGEINEEQAKVHPKKNVLMKAVGTETTIHPDFYKVNIQANSYFLFCTDGLSNKLSDETIQSTLFSTMSLEEKGVSLINDANSAGGEDNISLILLTNVDEEV